MKKVLVSMAIVAAMFAAASCGNNQKKAEEKAPEAVEQCCGECTEGKECCGKCEEGKECCGKEACCEQTECPDYPAETSEAPAEE